MTGRRLILARVWLCLAACVPAGAAAPAGAPRVQVVPLIMRPRMNGPLPVEVQIDWGGSGLLEGRLEFEFREHGRMLGRHRSSEMAVAAGHQEVRMLLPQLQPAHERQVDLRLAFVTKQARYELEPQVIPSAVSGVRSLVVAVCSARDTRSSALGAFEQSLRLERFAPEGGSGLGDRALMTTLARLTPDDLPAQPLAYCAYDVMVLAPGAVRGARQRSLDALARWVAGGGSLCVFAGTEPDPAVDALIQGFAREGRDRAGVPAGVRCFHSGWGRCAVVARAPDAGDDYESPGWRSVAAFLWQMSLEASERVVRDGKWDWQFARMEDYERQYRAGSGDPRLLNQLEGYDGTRAMGGQVLTALMPTTVRMVPIPLLVLTLGLFVLLIGPGDWWLLGRLRRRRYTWLLFPAVTAAFTVAMVLLANRYLGQRDLQQTLLVLDVGPGGKIVRQNRYDLLFSGGSRSVVTTLRGSLWAPLDCAGWGGWSEGQGGKESPLVTEGTVPASLKVTRQLRQWQPELSRTFTFEPSVTNVLPINWSAVEAFARAGQSADARRASFLTGPAPAADFVFFRPATHRSVPGGANVPEDLLVQLCATRPQGMMRVLAGVSPTGGNTFEDLLALDPTDPSHVLAVAATRWRGDIVVYRRLYHVN